MILAEYIAISEKLYHTAMRGSKPLTLSDMRFVEGSLRWLSRFRHGECWTNRGAWRGAQN